MSAEPVAIGVDGGGSKTDAVAFTLDGREVARRRGPSSSVHFKGLDFSVAVVDELVRAVAGEHPIAQVDLYLSALDLPEEIVTYREAIAPLTWATEATVVENDLFALLRAGTDAPDAVVVICGTGVNAIGVRADGASVRFPSLGPLSGDWGGGSGLGAEALWHAARDLDGRGPHTSLTSAIAETFRRDSLMDVIKGLHFGTLDSADLSVLAPAVFAACDAGDAVAQSLVDRQASEIVAFARACLTRLDRLDVAVPVVLGGGISAAQHPRLMAGVQAGLAADAPLAKIEVFDGAPLVGAALLALAHAGAGDPQTVARVRAGL